MICPHCGVLLPEGVKVCGNCGHPLPERDLGKTVVESPPTVVESEPGKTKVVPSPEEQPIFGWLVVVEGRERWREFRIPEEERQFLIGSGEECDFHLPEVEKLHASLRIREGKLFVTDLDTESGTFLNGEPVVREEVKHGDELKLGPVRLKFVRFPK